MSFSFSSIIKKAKKHFAQKKVAVAIGTRENVTTDWKIILVTLSALAVVAVGASSFWFYRIQSGSAVAGVSSNVSAKEVTINRTALEETIRTLDAKQAALQEARNNPPEISDPVR